MAENICSGVASLNYLVTNILQFARAEKPVKRRVMIEDCLEKALLLASHLIVRAGVELKRRYTSGGAAVAGDGEMLKQAFLNIVINAVQAMDKGGVLEITVEEKKAGVEVVFSDNGVGIPAGVMKNIFDPFYSTKEKGSGLGLAIVHNIIDGHGGKVSLESSEGKGTTVRVFLPNENG